MSIIGKGYFINSNSAILHVVAPTGSIVTASCSDKTITKSSGRQQTGREWVSDYYFRIPSSFYGYWSVSGVNQYNESLKVQNGPQDITQEIEYNNSLFLNAPILEYEDLEYININNNITTFGLSGGARANAEVQIILNAQSSGQIIQASTSQGSGTNILITFHHNNYQITENTSPINTNLSEKVKTAIVSRYNDSQIWLAKNKTLIGTTITQTPLYNVADTSIIENLSAQTELEIYNVESSYYFVNYNKYDQQGQFVETISGRVIKNDLDANGTIVSTSTLTGGTVALSNTTYFYGAYIPSFSSKGSNTYPAYFYPVKRLSDNKIGILRKAWKLDSWGESMIVYYTFLTGDSDSYITGPIRTTREAWIES